MSRRRKLQKFADILRYPNVLENYDPTNAELLGEKGTKVKLKGNWAKDHFKNDKPICLELACGRGEYSLALAERHIDTNYIGLDVKGARIWKGATIALEKEIANVAFLRTRIENILAFFGKNEISEIWITFPDPFIRKSKVNRRLTSHFFLEKYKQLLKPDNVLHLKTDSDFLFEFSQESISTFEGANILIQESDIYSKSLLHPDLDIKTYYEKMHLEDGRKIKYIQFQLSK